MEYGYARTISMGFEEADSAIRKALEAKGFGVLTEINVHDALKNKLGVDFRRYRILGACNPPIAHQALSADLGIGLLLPCNVVIWENDDKSTTVSAIDAGKMLAISDRDDLSPLAARVNNLLREAVDNL